MIQSQTVSSCQDTPQPGWPVPSALSVAHGVEIPRFTFSSLICLDGVGPNSSSMGLNIRLTRTLLLEKMSRKQLNTAKSVTWKGSQLCPAHASSPPAGSKASSCPLKEKDEPTKVRRLRLYLLFCSEGQGHRKTVWHSSGSNPFHPSEAWQSHVLLKAPWSTQATSIDLCGRLSWPPQFSLP